jgi:hypothetical protein
LVILLRDYGRFLNASKKSEDASRKSRRRRDPPRQGRKAGAERARLFGIFSRFLEQAASCL